MEGKTTEHGRQGRPGSFLSCEEITFIFQRKHTMNISVIVPTYNRPQALRLCLLSLAEQSTLPSEVMIADDGSGPETREAVIQMKNTLKHKFPIHHVWQEDIGFRKPKILNEAVRQSSGDYLIFIDGDCMAHRHFINAHVESGSSDAILSGKRVDLGKNLTEQLLKTERLINTFHFELLWDAMFGNGPKTRKVEESFIIRNKLLRRILHRDFITNDGVWGCNFSISRELFYAINGCDEDFLDGSIEDNDLGIRVLNQGKKIKSVRNLAVVFHLWHKSTWSFENEKYRHNISIMNKRITNREQYCKNGIRKLE